MPLPSQATKQEVEKYASLVLVPHIGVSTHRQESWNTYKGKIIKRVSIASIRLGREQAPNGKSNFNSDRWFTPIRV